MLSSPSMTCRAVRPPRRGVAVKMAPSVSTEAGVPQRLTAAVKVSTTSGPPMAGERNGPGGGSVGVVVGPSFGARSFRQPTSPAHRNCCPVHVLSSNELYASKQVNRFPFSA